MAEREAFINATSLRQHLPEALREVKNRPVVLLRHSAPVATLLDYERYTKLLDYIDDLEDKLSVYESASEPEDLKVPYEKVQAEAGLF